MAASFFIFNSIQTTQGNAGLLTKPLVTDVYLQTCHHQISSQLHISSFRSHSNTSNTRAQTNLALGASPRQTYKIPPLHLGSSQPDLSILQTAEKVALICAGNSDRGFGTKDPSVLSFMPRQWQK